MPLAIILLLALVTPLPAFAQGLPPLAPVNPIAASRSGLSFEPYRDFRPGRWTFAVALDYGSTIEDNTVPGATYLLDTELLRLRLGAARDIGARSYVFLDGDISGAYGGFLDEFLEWYHGVLGIEIPERERRPFNDFFYSVELSDGSVAARRPSDLFLGDLRMGLGVRATPALQTVFALTLPTATGPAGYGRGVISVNLLNTVRAPINPRLLYEGSLSAGYTPAHGLLSAFQEELLVAASSGLRLRLWGRQSVYGNLFYHSPYYDGTSLPSLDRRELSIDFGWLLATRGGTEWRVGMTEDLEPSGPAIDLVFRLGASF
ncbi:MAG: DUF3187 family protein [Gemmatimonadales bacterium]|nr:DUF3187 family protein [Gemmatimonadales bacterium]MBA3553955.1 DUF3187 family protein [Gemmatimonadales bacterium]